MAIRNIRQVGDPILRKTSKEVKEVNDRIKILTKLPFLFSLKFHTLFRASNIFSPPINLLFHINAYTQNTT